jgi:hypothetical protein
MILGTAERELGRYRESRSTFDDLLPIATDDHGDRMLQAHYLEGVSGLASALGQHQRALRLGGAAAALREANGAPLGPAWQPLVDRWLAISRQALGEQAAAEAWAAGRRLSLAQALAEAAEPLPVLP